MRGLLLVGAAMLCAPTAVAETLVFGGTAPADDLDHFFVPFEVPPGVREIEVRHDDGSELDVLDWGLEDEAGRFRGWGGGNGEPAVVGELAASRGYLAGPIGEGTWRVVVGKAKVVDPDARYSLEVDLRDTPRLPADERRGPYADPGVLEDGTRWYSGDFHVHSLESGDALAPLDAIGDLAVRRGLDFVVITDHNTVSHSEYLAAAQARFPRLLFVPGMELTTYDGHANAIGLAHWVDHKIGQPGVTIAGAARAIARQGALFSINHPVHDLGDLCIGCAWKHALAPEAVDAVEIATGGFKQTGQLFLERAVSFWDDLCATGRHAAALGGSDDHRAGTDPSPLASPIGDPTTMVRARSLSVAGILEAVRAGRTVVKLQGPSDPMLEIEATPALEQGVVEAPLARLVARAEGATGFVVRWIRNGDVVVEAVAGSDPFELTLDATAPESGEHRFRAEIVINDAPRVITSHVYLRRGTAPTRFGDTYPKRGVGAGGGCRASAGAGAWPGLALALVAAMSARRAATRSRKRAGSGAEPRFQRRRER